MTSPIIDPQLLSTLQTQPETERDLLGQVNQADEQTGQALEAMGLILRRRLTLLPTFAVTGPAHVCLRLLDCTWVQSIEEDRPIHIMKLARHSGGHDE